MLDVHTSATIQMNIYTYNRKKIFSAIKDNKHKLYFNFLNGINPIPQRIDNFMSQLELKDQDIN